MKNNKLKPLFEPFKNVTSTTGNSFKFIVKTQLVSEVGKEISIFLKKGKDEEIKLFSFQSNEPWQEFSKNFPNRIKKALEKEFLNK